MKRTITKVSPREAKQEADLLANDTNIIQWKNTGGGSFRLGRQIIKPGQVFLASQKEISQNFRDVLKPIGLASPQEIKTKISGVKPTFKIKEREEVKDNFKLKEREGEEGYYDVVSVITQIKDGKNQEKEKAINTKPLTKAKATKLLNDLMA